MWCGEWGTLRIWGHVCSIIYIPLGGGTGAPVRPHAQQTHDNLSYRTRNIHCQYASGIYKHLGMYVGADNHIPVALIARCGVSCWEGGKWSESMSIIYNILRLFNDVLSIIDRWIRWQDTHVWWTEANLAYFSISRNSPRGKRSANRNWNRIHHK